MNTAKRSRTQNSVNNTLWGAMFFVVKMLLQFVVRALFIRFLGNELLGLNGLFTNVLNMLSLAELGIGNAIVYSMYDPIAKGNIEKTKALLRVYRNIYIGIGSVVTVVGLALIPALPHLIKDVPDTPYNINVLYVIYLLHSVIGYFFAYRRALVFASQRNDIEHKVGIISQIVMAVAQIIVMVTIKNYYYYAGAMVVGSIVDAVSVFAISYKLFPQMRGRGQKLEREDGRTIVINSSAKFVQAIGWNAVFSTDSLIISSFLGLGILGIYSNYTLIMTSLISVVNMFCTAVKGSVGNLITGADTEKINKVFNALTMALFWLIGFIFTGMVCCYQDFIVLFTGSEEYLLGFVTMFLLSLQFLFRVSRYMVETFKDCAGLIRNDWFRPLLEAGVNLGLDFLLLHFMGIDGIILATIISTLFVSIWIEAYVLCKHCLKRNLLKYFARYFIYLLLVGAVCAATFGVCYFVPSGGFWWFVLKFGICLILPNCLFFAVLFKTKEFRYFVGAAKSLLSRKKGNNVMDMSNEKTVSEEDLNKLKEIELGIMKDVDKFCTENGIKYTLAYGTAIGAVRHGGFIPWDDDIDICMPRSDYDKFLSLWSENPIDGYYLQGTRECDKTTINHSKIRKIGTVYASKKEYESDPEHHGIWVDIFALDKVPDNEKIRKKLIFKGKIRMIYTRGKAFSRVHGIKKFIVNLMLLLPKSAQQKIKAKCEKFITQYNEMEENFVYKSFNSIDDMNIDFPPTLFDELTRIKFEDAEFLISSQYDEMLRAAYGDYMALPPVEQQIPGHAPEVFDFGAIDS